MVLDLQLSADACSADGVAERGDAPALLELLTSQNKMDQQLFTKAEGFQDQLMGGADGIEHCVVVLQSTRCHVDLIHRDSFAGASWLTGQWFLQLFSDLYYKLDGVKKDFTVAFAIDPDIDAATAMMLLNTPPEIQAGFPPGVIQNGARVLSRGIFPGARPLPINPIGSMAVAVRTGWKSFKMNGITNCRMRTESEQSCGSPVVSGDPKEDHNYSSAKSSNHRSTSPASDSVSSSSADDQYEFATKGSQDSSEGSEVSFQSHESHSETEEEDKKQNRKETKDSLADSGYASQHKKRQHLMKAKKVPSDTLPLKKRRTEKPPESDDEEMKEAAGSLLHLAGIRSCLNNITNRTAKGQKEQKETTKN
ncbi:hypothetical protein Q9233_000798 [Columba guinea]|nr:hypothetical protein Q9233_000798 [Columba guinea]